ncbi:hypothetical protein ACLI09_02655 [Flavobacterium sp. RHBU_24]|uniref:hypothetical protein n=1 Tax=Flavobacterium sp. RHBU_24 TaxID=3391185 RepID=UPI003984B046
MNTIDTDEFSAKLRTKAIDLNEKKILITNYKGSLQEKDLTEPANCAGFGRVRHFKLKPGGDWPENPLPIEPARKYLNLRSLTEIRAQVFQNSVCNWRCWYCFVDFKLLNGDSRFSKFLSCDELLDLYLAENNRPLMIDLSGGQPDLTPEWVPWMMEAIIARGLENDIFLWSDDNLSNDYFWRYLSQKQIDLINSYKMYARVCCFKGIDEHSFMLNTLADPKLFSEQFDLFKRLWNTNIDLYGYITLTAPSNTDFKYAVSNFLDKLQAIHEDIPLKIVPLKVFEFTPSQSRNNVDKADLIKGQQIAIETWKIEMSKRFSTEKLNMPIYDIKNR